MDNSKIMGNSMLETPKEEKRIKSIDRFRGACVFSMIVFQFIAHFDNLGWFTRLANHGLDRGIVILPGMTLADIIAPAFIFAIGLTYALSFYKWKDKNGVVNANIHYFERALSIIGIGAFLAIALKVVDSFDGYEFLDGDIAALVFGSFAILGVVLLIISKFVNNKVFSKVSSQVLYISLSLLGLLDLVLSGIDYASLSQNGPEIYHYWLVLQCIGMAILMALPFVRSKWWLKVIVGLAIFIGFTCYHQIPENQVILEVQPHGGIMGGLGWGAMLLFDMAIADLYFEKDKTTAYAASMFTFVLGVFLTQWLGPITMGTCSPTFILVGTGLPGTLFAIFDVCDKYAPKHFDFLVWWGKNPMVMFLVEFFVVGSYTMFLPDAAIKDAPVWLAAIQVVLMTIVLTAFTYLLSRKKKTISV